MLIHKTKGGNFLKNKICTSNFAFRGAYLFIKFLKDPRKLFSKSFLGGVWGNAPRKQSLDLSCLDIKSLVGSVAHRECLSRENAVEHDRREELALFHTVEDKSDGIFFS